VGLMLTRQLLPLILRSGQLPEAGNSAAFRTPPDSFPAPLLPAY
jgi:hypothetical protein